jgi:putative transposase
MLNIRPELLDELLQNYNNPQDLIGEDGILKQLTKALVERCLESEIQHQMTTEPEDPVPGGAKNRRNGHSKKTIQGSFGTAEIKIPRDRNGDYEPQLIGKHQRRFDGFDEKVIALYARGMSTRDIEAAIHDLYGVTLSAGMVSEITNGVETARKAWQHRTLDRVYPIVFLDALVLKVRQEGRVINKAVHLALGVNMAGKKELLGMWMTENESSKFWLSVLTDLNNRGVQDIYIACCDGLTGFPDAIETVFPQARVQLCIVHTLHSRNHRQ